MINIYCFSGYIGLKRVSISSCIFNPSSKPFNIGFPEWTAYWWKWLISIPRFRNPAFDDTGEFGGTFQCTPDVWFLAGTFGGSADRSCTVPTGKAILYPVINYECSFADQTYVTTEQGLEKRCKTEMDQIGDLYAKLDGEEIELRNYRVKSGCFTIDIPTNNCIGAVAGTTTMASDGFWLFFDNLPRGRHELISFGSCLAGRIKIGCTYHLIIV